MVLTALNIQDFILISRLALPLGGGLTALTGETGAGKSILLDALGLAVGGRAGRGAVRRGALQGVVAATFEPAADHPVWRTLEENALPADEDQIILRRVQGADGRGRAFINDQPVSVGLLRTIGECLLEIHGQHDGRGFLSASAHRGMLDEYAGLKKQVAAVGNYWRDWREAEETLDSRRRNRDQNLREVDYLRHVVDELEKLDPQAEEEAELATRRAELMAAEKIAEDLTAAAALLSEDSHEGKLSAALGRLERASAVFESDHNPLAEALEKLDAAVSETMEARAAVEDAAERLGYDARELEMAEERLFALRGAARKHGVSPEALPAFLNQTKTALAELESGESAFEAIEARVKEARAVYFDAARALSRERRKAAAALDAAVAKELKPLKLAKAQFETAIVSDENRTTSDGIDQVEFMVATNPGSPPGPLKTIASGGELSRFVLAMKAALAVKENRTVIIFDEVDAGVGGAVADAVGERLARLAQGAQVLVVTHSPQVAARADAHWRVDKKQGKATSETTVAVLDADDRVEEIARMLSGARITDEARAAARQLLGAPAAKTAAKPRRRKAG